MKSSVQRLSILGVVFVAAVGLHGASEDLPIMDGVPTAEPEAVGMSEELIGILLTQMRPYTHLRIRDDLATMTYQAIVN